jgi:hypothetical protein
MLIVKKFTEIGEGILFMEYIFTNFMLRGNLKNVTIYIWQYIHILH